MQQHTGQDAARPLGQPAQKDSAGKGRQPLRQIEMQQTEEQRRRKDGRCAAAGVKAIIATDISRDGTMQGTNLDLYRELLTIPDIEVTASGGIARMEELAELQAMGCHAAILGKSIYTGAIDLADAVRRYQA